MHPALPTASAVRARADAARANLDTLARTLDRLSIQAVLVFWRACPTTITVVEDVWFVDDAGEQVPVSAFRDLLLRYRTTDDAANESPRGSRPVGLSAFVTRVLNVERSRRHALVGESAPAERGLWLFESARRVARFEERTDGVRVTSPASAGDRPPRRSPGVRSVRGLAGASVGRVAMTARRLRYRSVRWIGRPLAFLARVLLAYLIDRPGRSSSFRSARTRPDGERPPMVPSPYGRTGSARHEYPLDRG